ncbi:unnamed protein product, partial [Owenia fusiformis]
NSVRHNLSLNKSFAKIENPKNNGNTKKGCLWGLNPVKIDRMDEEIAKWNKKEPLAIKRSMSKPGKGPLIKEGALIAKTTDKLGKDIIIRHYLPGTGHFALVLLVFTIIPKII